MIFVALQLFRVIYSLKVGVSPLQFNYENQYDTSAWVQDTLDVVEAKVVEAKTQDVEFLVLPECTISCGGPWFNTREQGLEVGEVFPTTLHQIECDNPEFPILGRLSCIAQQQEVAFLVNMVEILYCDSQTDDLCPSDGRYQFNVNVAFNSTGHLVGRYRKVHLWGEAHKMDKAPPEVVKFKIGELTIGTVVCYDLFHAHPLAELAPQVDAIAFTSYWVPSSPVYSLDTMANSFSFYYDTIIMNADHVHGSGIYERGQPLTDGRFDFQLMTAEVHKADRRRLQECVDNVDFRDATGAPCTYWRGYDCSQAADIWPGWYNPDQQADIGANCCASCAYEGDVYESDLEQTNCEILAGDPNSAYTETYTGPCYRINSADASNGIHLKLDHPDNLSCEAIFRINAERSNTDLEYVFFITKKTFDENTPHWESTHDPTYVEACGLVMCLNSQYDTSADILHCAKGINENPWYFTSVEVISTLNEEFAALPQVGDGETYPKPIDVNSNFDRYIYVVSNDGIDLGNVLFYGLPLNGDVTAVTGEDYCENEGMRQNEPACKASSCCHWWTENGHCASNIGNSVCTDSDGQNVVESTSINWLAGFSDANARAMELNVGDSITFTWMGRHNVYQMPSEEAFDSCDFSDAIEIGSDSGVEVTLNSLPSYFACEISGHCMAGQKLAVTEIVESTEYAINWVAGFSDASARAMEAKVGDSLTFTWRGRHNVYQMPSYEAFTTCDFSSATNLGSNSGVEVTLDSLPAYFACEVSGHCMAGQKLAVTEVEPEIVICPICDACPEGWESADEVDENGCHTCGCIEPCEMIECTDGCEVLVQDRDGCGGYCECYLECPEEQPEVGDSCNPNVGLSCEYGEYCCCGECMATTFTDCSEDGWMLALIDMLPCDPTCGATEEPAEDCETCVSRGQFWSVGYCMDSCEIMDVACYSTLEGCEAERVENEGSARCAVHEDCDSCLEDECYWSSMSDYCFYSVPFMLGYEEQTCDVPILCEMVACMEGCEVVGQDENGCGGSCECPVICPICDACPEGWAIVDEVDEYGCHMCGCMEPETTPQVCEMVACMEECELVGQDKNGCSGECECPVQECPEQQPAVGDRCYGMTEVSCEYGEYCCCGECMSTAFADCWEGLWMIALIDVMPCQCETEAPEPETTYDAPDERMMASMSRLLASGASEARFTKLGRRAGNILQQKKQGDVLHPDVKSAMQNIKRFSKQEYTENRWNKMENNYNKVEHHG